MSVTRCVCVRRTFATLLMQARAEGLATVPELTAATGAGGGCGSCRPYLAAMLAHGHTRFAVAVDGGEPRPCGREPFDAE